jgi:hypothetical protein
MPDPQRKTISATQSPALFNASPYITRWMLYRFLKGDEIDPVESGRMSWGKKLQPLVLEQAGTDLKLEIRPNFDNQYVRAKLSPLGATVDATIMCPDRGPGAIETKCVFDYAVWMREWNGGKNPPRHYELQLQQQLLVGDGEKSYQWGVIAAWLAGEIKYFERKLLPQVADTLHANAMEMMEDVKRGAEPAPFGSELEIPLLTKLFPLVPAKTLDLRMHGDGARWAQHATMLVDFTAQQNFYSKAADDAKAKLRALAKDNELVLLPHGVTLKQSTRTVKEHMRKASTSTTLKVEIGPDMGGGDAAIDLPTFGA